MRQLALVALLATACSIDSDRVGLPNSAGKDDSVAIRLKLTDSNPAVSFAVGCDQPHGCEGFVGVELMSPEPCALFPGEPGCGVSPTNPLSLQIATTVIISTTEGQRVLPFKIESTDGLQFTKEQAAAFSARSNEDVEVMITKAPGTPDLTIEVRAEWVASTDPGGEADAVKTYLSTVPGLTFQETGTWLQGYRAFALEYEQPIDHANPALGTLKQRMVLQHRVKAAPVVLYTSGYALYNDGYLSELGTALQANQLSTEQRYFGTSTPANMTPDSWQHVTIEQAAKDHHRIVEALRPFYSTNAWLSTGHSKGGMTSIFHRRYFPSDVDATVAYVAPISFANPDPRYIPFLDQIGDAACRNAIRAVQKRAFEQFDQLMTLAEPYMAGYTFERTGGTQSSFEKSLLQLEWGFWQGRTAADCAPFLNAPTSVDGLFNLVVNNVGVGMPDIAFDDILTYYYQAVTQLGLQSFATAHLAGLTRHESIPINYAPVGTMPVHDPAPMHDVQSWVKTQANQLLFVYGQHDPWSGGAYELGTQADVVKLVAPGANHAAMIESLSATDRKTALDKIEAWIGQRPNLGTPGVTPRAPAPRLF